MSQRLVSSVYVVIACLSVLGCGPKESAQSTGASSEPPKATPAPAAEQPGAPAPAQAEPAAAERPSAQEGTQPLADPAQHAELGKPAPSFTLTGVDGNEHALSALRGKTVVLEWFNPDCPFVKFAHTKGPLADQAKQTMNDEVVWLSINSGGDGKQGHGLQRNQQALTDYGMQNPILLDPTGAVGKAFGAEKTPHLFVVDPQGVLVYRGGIDNAPIGAVDANRPRYDDSPADAVVNYIRGALEDMKAKRALRLPETPPYGCSVKYSS